MPGLHRSIQEPVVECLVAESYAAELFAPVHIPGADAHADLLRPRVFVVALTHSQQHSWRGCQREKISVRMQILGVKSFGLKENKQMGESFLILLKKNKQKKTQTMKIEHNKK